MMIDWSKIRINNARIEDCSITDARIASCEIPPSHLLEPYEVHALLRERRIKRLGRLGSILDWLNLI